MMIESIRQDNKQLISCIGKWGCYFLCLHYFISVFKGIEFTVSDININYGKFVCMELIRSNCYILDPCRILKAYGLATSVRRESSTYKPVGREFEISEVKIKDLAGYHFMATRDSSVLYDSLALKERGMSYSITSKRIFNLI
ncbi:hypothetical protein DB313_06350 (plasmid) [Borrelia turcica IST7]|uniref:DUF261 domain-containing protein n=1 Tax=Borrelia turcica IST7 TaxID=1104446 RepID=A0A386PNT1_9SPIR|nr:DUF261 family protein [Borrelia turcica]AYE37121.1 hypothetical protein DB313_06350 [Borrelia turcica IST7]